MNNVAVHHEKTPISLGFSYPLSTQRMNRLVIWASMRENLTSGSLISTSVFRLLESTISKLITNKFSIFSLVSIAE